MAVSAMRKIRPAARAAEFGGAIKVPITGGEEFAGREAARRRVLERDEPFQSLLPRLHGKQEQSDTGFPGSRRRRFTARVAKRGRGFFAASAVMASNCARNTGQSGSSKSKPG